MAFLEDAPGLHQTGVCRGAADEADWTQTPFEWNLPDDPRVLRHDRRLVVMVYDKDQITNDDLIGCVTIRMGEILQGPFDGWREIQRHGEPTFEWIKGLIYTKTGPPPQLKVRVALRVEQPDESSMVIPSAERLHVHSEVQHSAVHPHAGLPAWPDEDGEFINENPMLPSAKPPGRAVYSVQPLREAALADNHGGRYPDVYLQSLPSSGTAAFGQPIGRQQRANAPAPMLDGGVPFEHTGTPMEQLHVSPGGSGSGTPWAAGEAAAGVYTGSAPRTFNRGLHLSESQSAVAQVESHLVFA